MNILLNRKSKHWEIQLEVGNDWGEPSYTRTKEFSTKEEVESFLEYLDYYSVVLSIREVTEYEYTYR